MDWHGTAELVSMALTVPTIVMSVYVVIQWRDGAGEAIRKRRDKRSVAEWFMLGVAVGFAGAALDNLYWGVAWSANYLELESANAIFLCGVYANIPFRQIAGLYAAYCHIRSAFAFTECEKLKELKVVTIVSLAIGMCYAAALVVAGSK